MTGLSVQDHFTYVGEEAAAQRLQGEKECCSVGSVVERQDSGLS